MAALKLVAREFKQGLEKGYNLHGLEAFFALGTPLNQKHVMYKTVQLIVNGVTTVFGVSVAKLVEVESKQDQDMSGDQLLEEVKTVLANLRKKEIAEKTLAQLPANGTILESGVLAVRIVEEDGKDDPGP